MLELKNITKKFDRVIFDNLSIRFPNKGFVLIIGESGCGKSTLFNIILGIESVDEGEIIYNDTILKKENFKEFRKNEIGAIFQDYGLIEYYTIKQNLLLSIMNIKNKITDNDLINILKKVGINKKLNTICKNLSGGEKQRVAIARSLLIDKNIIICDEPSGSLDNENGEKILSFLKEESKERLVICISHNLSYIKKYADYTFDLNLKKYLLNKPKINEHSVNNFYENKRISFFRKLSFSINSLKRRKLRSIISVFSYFLVLIILLISMSLNYSIKNNIDNNFTNYINYNMLEVSVVENINKKDNGIVLTKMKRPDVQVLNDKLKNWDYQLTYNLSDLLKNSIFTKNNKKIEVNFVPFNKISNTNYSIYQNMVDNMDYQKVFVNESAYKLINESVDINIKKSILTYDSFYNKAIDNIDISYELKVVKVIEEFELFEQPTIYYHYQSYKDYLSRITLTNASSLLARKVTIFDRYSSLSLNDESLSSYSYLLWLNQNDVIKLKDLLEKYGYDISSVPLQNKKQIENVLLVATDVINLFLIICFVIVFSLISMIIYSIIRDRKKEIVLYKINGINSNEIRRIICLDSLLISGITIILLISFKDIILKLINEYIKKYILIDDFLQINFYSLLFIIIMALSIGYLFSLIPYFCFNKTKESELIR